jgi:hypothetical protein
VDHTGSGAGKRTTGTGGVIVVVMGDKETNASLGDSVWHGDGVCDDSEVDHTESGSGE